MKLICTVRFPLDMGLIGWRVFLIRAADAPAFAKVHTVDDLKKLQAGQGHDWPDTQILLASGLPVQTSSSYPSLFEMLRVGRFDYFPRSVTEVWDEVKSRPEMKIAVEKTLVLQYPSAFYFFVHKQDKALADVLEAGLRVAQKDGSFRKLFDAEFANDLKRANLKGRTRIQIANPALPAETPLHDKSLWFDF